MPEEDMVDIKFRLYDGSDIGPFRCSSSTSTVDMLKQRIVSDWPRGKTITPKNTFWGSGRGSYHNACCCTALSSKNQNSDPCLLRAWRF